MTDTDVDLDALLDALAERARARAETKPIFNQDGVDIGLRASTGRLVVHPGDVIASTWGNTTYDQTVQVYDTPAARDSQWPTPKDGAIAYTVDTGSLWVRRSGAWKMLPLGYLASTVGPTTAVTVGTTLTTVMSVAATVAAGRRYRITVFGFGQQAGTVGNSFFQVATSSNIDNIQPRFVHQNALPIGSYLIGTGVFVFSPTASGAQTWTLSGQTSAGTMNVVANSCMLLVEDIGSP